LTSTIVQFILSLDKCSYKQSDFRTAAVSRLLKGETIVRIRCPADARVGDGTSSPGADRDSHVSPVRPSCPGSFPSPSSS